jgi:hypothetical protein
VRASSGNSGWVAYRSTNAAKPASITGTIGNCLPWASALFLGEPKGIALYCCP